MAPRPFAHGSLASLRLLAGFALASDEAAPVRPLLLRLAGAEGLPACASLPRLVEAVRRDAHVAWTLDGALAALLGHRVDPRARRSVFTLAASWRSRAASLEGPDLAALVWWVARDGRVAMRPLERKIVTGLAPARLLSRAQRAVLQGEPQEAIRSEEKRWPSSRTGRAAPISWWREGAAAW